MNAAAYERLRAVLRQLGQVGGQMQEEGVTLPQMGQVVAMLAQARANHELRPAQPEEYDAPVQPLPPPLNLPPALQPRWDNWSAFFTALNQTFGWPNRDQYLVYAEIAAILAQGVETPQPPAVVSYPVLSGSTIIGNRLTCSTGTWSGGPTSYAYQWYRDGVQVADQTPGVPANCRDTIVSVDENRTFYVVVTATNALGPTIAPQTNSILVVPAPNPVELTNPVIGGNPTVGSTLTCVDPGTWTGTAPITYTYEWSNSSVGVVQPNSPTTTYVVKPGDQGFMVSVRVTASNIAGTKQGNSTNIGPIT